MTDPMPSQIAVSVTSSQKAREVVEEYLSFGTEEPVMFDLSRVMRAWAEELSILDDPDVTKMVSECDREGNITLNGQVICKLNEG